MNIIEIVNLKKYFGAVKAVDDISFSVKEGELFAFLGLNGAGKSTTINIICGILKKDCGKVVIDGVNIDENNYKSKGKIGVVFQESVRDKKLSVRDNLESRAGLYNIFGSDFENRLNEIDELLHIKEIIKNGLWWTFRIAG